MSTWYVAKKYLIWRNSLYFSEEQQDKSRMTCVKCLKPVIRLVLFKPWIVSLGLTVGERCTFILKEFSICMMHKAGKWEGKKKKISSVVVALRDVITFLRQLPISSAAGSMYSPVWCCVLLMTDHDTHDTSLLLLLGILHSFESPLNITGKNCIPLTSSSFCSGEKKFKKKSPRWLWGNYPSWAALKCKFLLLLIAWGLDLFSSGIWCKILKIKIWGKSFILSLQGDRELGQCKLAIFIISCCVSGFIYTFIQILL